MEKKIEIQNTQKKKCIFCTGGTFINPSTNTEEICEGCFGTGEWDASDPTILPASFGRVHQQVHGKNIEECDTKQE